MVPNFKQKRVFLDTEVFTGEGFNLNSTKLAEIRRLGSEKKILCVMPTVTVKECKRRIEKLIRTAKNEIKDLRSALRILQQTTLDCSLLKDLDAKSLAAEIEQNFDQYLRDCNTVFCNADRISAETVMDAYFAGLPPFGPEQKKDQFPDAVAVLALSEWQAKDKNPVHVISNDGDLVAACRVNGDLLLHSDLSEFLNLHNKEAQEQSAFVDEQINKNRAAIKKAIDHEFVRLGFNLLGEFGDVEGVVVTDIDLGETSIVALHEEYADVELDVSVSFSAEVSYEDSASGWWDSEDKRYYGLDAIRKTIDREEEFTVTVELSWDEVGNSEFTLDLGLKDVDVDLYDRASYYR